MKHFFQFCTSFFNFRISFEIQVVVHHSFQLNSLSLPVFWGEKKIIAPFALLFAVANEWVFCHYMLQKFTDAKDNENCHFIWCSSSYIRFDSFVVLLRKFGVAHLEKPISFLRRNEKMTNKTFYFLIRSNVVLYIVHIRCLSQKEPNRRQ